MFKKKDDIALIRFIGLLIALILLCAICNNPNYKRVALYVGLAFFTYAFVIVLYGKYLQKLFNTGYYDKYIALQKGYLLKNANKRIALAYIASGNIEAVDSYLSKLKDDNQLFISRDILELDYLIFKEHKPIEELKDIIYKIEQTALKLDARDKSIVANAIENRKAFLNVKYDYINNYFSGKECNTVFEKSEKSFWLYLTTNLEQEKSNYKQYLLTEGIETKFSKLLFTDEELNNSYIYRKEASNFNLVLPILLVLFYALVLVTLSTGKKNIKNIDSTNIIFSQEIEVGKNLSIVKESDKVIYYISDSSGKIISELGISNNNLYTDNSFFPESDDATVNTVKIVQAEKNVEQVIDFYEINGIKNNQIYGVYLDDCINGMNVMNYTLKVIGKKDRYYLWCLH